MCESETGEPRAGNLTVGISDCGCVLGGDCQECPPGTSG